MKQNIIWIILLLLFIGGCEEELVAPSGFDVTSNDSISVVVKKGIPVTFKLDGNADIVYFYSGENGKRYEYINRASSPGLPQLQFSSLRANGKQDGMLRVMVSLDFPGITVGTDSISREATNKKISAATWTDITSRCILSTGTTVSSGAVDLSDFAQTGKPVFIAFKYLAQAGSIQNKWTISALTVKNTLSDGTVYTIANTTNAVIANYGVSTIVSPGWVHYTFTNTYFWALTSNNLVITGATSVAAAKADAEAWTLMGPVDLNKVSPDIGTHLKGYSDATLEEYTYTYASAGTYTATFVAATNNVYGQKEVVKQVQVTVRP